jgi:hypothetical protein
MPYGKHGEWGMYREGVKEMTRRISSGECGAAEASGLLKDVGVILSERSLLRRSTLEPGNSPSKSGPASSLSQGNQEKLAADVRFLRKHNLPVTKAWVVARAWDVVQGTPDEAHFPQGVMSDHVYYKFLDESDMSGGSGQPLESDRDLWLTSTVSTHPPHARTHTHTTQACTHARTHARTR